jgi:hypothetical protein
MNFQSLIFFKNIQQNPVPTYTGTGSCEVQKSRFWKNVWEPGSYLYRNRFLSAFLSVFINFHSGTRFLPTGNWFPRPVESNSALLTAFIHSKPNPNIPIRIAT